jgi:hypothetical protein
MGLDLRLSDGPGKRINGRLATSRGHWILIRNQIHKPGFELLSPFVLESKRARGELGL